MESNCRCAQGTRSNLRPPSPCPKLHAFLGELGVKILSVAGPTDEATMAACAEAGVLHDPGDGTG